MALTTCKECGHQVSTAAATCPQCGAPVTAQFVGVPTATVQLTSKKLKFHILLSTLLFMAGCIWVMLIYMVGDGAGSSSLTVAIITAFVGLFWRFLTQFRIWWHHR